METGGDEADKMKETRWNDFTTMARRAEIICKNAVLSGSENGIYRIPLEVRTAFWNG
jgi:hypothetical protein